VARERPEHFIPRCVVTAGSLHLDELVVAQGALGLGATAAVSQEELMSRTGKLNR
jgi:hypothetical protein